MFGRIVCFFLKEHLFTIQCESTKGPVWTILQCFRCGKTETLFGGNNVDTMTATEVEQRIQHKIESDKSMEGLRAYFDRWIYEISHRSICDIIAQQYLDGKPAGLWGWVETTRYGGGDD